jgi:hypothetical protein
VDLSARGPYARRHRVCEAHRQVASIVLDGQEMRYCQQCNKFEPLPLFEKERR